MGQCMAKTLSAPAALQRFRYKHVVITGASAGIGAAIAVQLSSLPDTTLTLIARNPARLAAVEAACKANGATVHAFTLDVTDTAAMAHALTQTSKAYPVDLVIANAGIVAAAPKSDLNMSSIADSIWAAGQTNIMGTLNTIAPALPLLKVSAAAGRPAAVAIVSSVSVLPPKAVQFTGQLQMGLLPYAWSKQALMSLGTGLEAELAGSGVSVFTVCPGVVLTGLAAGLAGQMMGSSAAATTSTAAAAAAIHRSDTASEAQVLKAAGADANLPQTVADDEVTAGKEARNVSMMKSGAKSQATVEDEMKRRLGAMTAEQAALHICAGLASGKGGVVAFPAAAVRTMKIMSLLPEKLLVKAVKLGMAKYNK